MFMRTLLCSDSRHLQKFRVEIHINVRVPDIAEKLEFQIFQTSLVQAVDHWMLLYVAVRAKLSCSGQTKTLIAICLALDQ